jgi:PAS domain S-box-containing protein
MTHTFSGGGEMGERIRSFDWSQTPLGPIEDWPQSLMTAVRIMLASRQPIWLGWGEQLIKLYNDPYKAIVGGKHPAALGQPAAVVWREIWDAIGPMLQTAMTGTEGTYVEAQLLIMERNGYPEETYYTFSYSPIPDDTGGVGGIICANTDDTRRVIGERQLALLSELASKTADARTVADACMISAGCLATNPYDLPFALIYLVDADEQRLVRAGTCCGIDPGHAVAAETVALDSAAVWPFAEVLATNRPCLVSDLNDFAHDLPTGAWDRPPHQAVALPIPAQGPTGTAGILVVGLNPYRLFDDGYAGFLELVAAQIATTIANAQAYERERQRAEALAELDRAKTAFFSNVSHEFRTPLTLMLGPLEDLQQQLDGALPPEQREQLEVAYRNALRLLRLVNMLLDFSRIETGRIQASYAPTDLAAFTTDLASVFRSTVERAGLRLVVDCPPLPAPVYVDHDMWEQIVFNLLSNAFKYTFAGEITVALRQIGTMAELAVRDTGTGIPAEEIPHLFERFHRVRGARGRTFEGSGIGLALVQELVTLHGGTVRVTSAIDQGSTFSVTIPLGMAHLPADRMSDMPVSASTSMRAEAYVEEAARWLPDERVAARLPDADMMPQDAHHKRHEAMHARILLADDNADMRAYVRRLLSQTYEVVAVPDGAAALRAARAQPPDLVLTDVMMPELDGFALLKAIRADERLKTIPVIMLSARAGEESRVEGLEAGADDYLVKPFSARELLARVTARLELARLRAQLDQERAALVTLFQQSPVPIAVLRGPDLVYDLANPTYCHVVGDRHVQGKPLLEALPELNGQGFDDLLRRVMQTGVPVVQHEALLKLERHGRPEDTYWTFIYAPLHNASGHVDSVVAISNEVTEQVQARRQLEQMTSQLTAELTTRRQVEAALRLSEEHMRLVLESADIGTWDYRPLTGVLVWDTRCKELFGLSPDAAVSYDRFLEALHPEDREWTDAIVQRALDQASGGRYDVEYRAIGIEDGIERWLSANGQAFFDDTGRAVRLMGAVLDITERKRAEVEREQQLAQERHLRAQAEEASRLKDEFLATISHELRTPLTAFLGYAQMLHRHTGDQAYVARTVEKLVRSAKNQAQLIEDLLDISRIVSGKLRIEPQPIDLTAVIHAALDTVRPAMEAKELHLYIDVSPEASLLIGDANRLQQVVWNLLANATKFTPHGGSIQVQLQRRDRYAQLMISDTGQGISTDFLPFVFDRFRQADGTSNRAHGGLGLGLAIVRHLVELHGGTVHAASAGLDQGATFTVLLPLDIEDASAQPNDSGAYPEEGDNCPPELAGLRVLVVDDQQDIVDLVQEILAACGAVVQSCTNARAALEQVRVWQPDVLISDIAMPGEDGYWLIHHVRALPFEEGGGLPAAALTAYVRMEDRLQVLAAGFHLYVPKPLEPGELRKVVAQLARMATPD